MCPATISPKFAEVLPPRACEFGWALGTEGPTTRYYGDVIPPLPDTCKSMDKRDDRVLSLAALGYGAGEPSRMSCDET
jgi:hypothetical protein